MNLQNWVDVRLEYIFVHLSCFVDGHELPIKERPCIRYEYSIISAFLFFLESDLCRSWSSEITCSDSCPSGFGACKRHASKVAIREAGLCREKLRFQRLDPWEWAPWDRALGNFDEDHYLRYFCNAGDGTQSLSIRLDLTFHLTIWYHTVFN